MSDTKVNPNSEARREVNRPDRRGLDQGGRIVVPTRGPEKANFQKVLDEAARNPDSFFTPSQGQSTAPATKEAVRAVLSQQERYGKEKENLEKRRGGRDSDREEALSGSSKEGGTGRVKEAEKRVVARSSVSERRSQGGKSDAQGGEGGPGQGRRGRGFASGVEFGGVKGTRRGGVGEIALGRFGHELQAAASRDALSKAKAPSILTKALLDQIVQYCRLVTKTDGDKEIEMQLHEEIFKGLQLKVAMVKGKVEVTFFTPSEEVEGLFQARKADIHEALSEKGIDVRTINVVKV